MAQENAKQVGATLSSSLSSQYTKFSKKNLALYRQRGTCVSERPLLSLCQSELYKQKCTQIVTKIAKRVFYVLICVIIHLKTCFSEFSEEYEKYSKDLSAAPPHSTCSFTFAS